MSKLADLQAKLQRAILAGDGAILAELAESGAKAARRLEVYAKGYAARLTVLLRADYPVLAAHLGEKAFAALAEAYARAHPPTHPAARYAGSGLPAYLAEACDDDGPLLAEMALIETTLADASDAADGPVMTEAELDGVLDRLFEGDMAGLHLRPASSVRRLDLKSNARVVWTAHRTGEPPPGLAMQVAPDPVLIWRFGDEPYLRPLATEEAPIWDAMAAGEGLAGLLARFDDGDAAQDRLAGQLESWVAARLLAALA